MKGRVKHIEIEALDLDFSVVIGETAEDCFDAYNKEFTDSDSEDLSFNGNNKACTYQTVSTVASTGKYQICTILFLPSDRGGDKPAIVAHEAVHAAYYLISYAGIKIDVDNHEILARLVEYIFESAMKVIKDGYSK
jgi:hypothetical protein